MKKLLILLTIILIAASCDKHIVEKPDNLIEKDKMADIIYDLAVLDAMRSQKPQILESNGVNPDTYIYKKYKIDSLQFAKSAQYYASDVKEYKKIYEEVSKRLGENDKPGQPVNPDAPQVR